MMHYERLSIFLEWSSVLSPSLFCILVYQKNKTVHFLRSSSLYKFASTTVTLQHERAQTAY